MVNLFRLFFSFLCHLYGWIYRQILNKFGFIIECLVLFSSPIVIKKFAGNSNLDWHLWSPRVYRISVQALLPFRLFFEMSGIILIGLLSYVPYFFSLADFNVLSLFHNSVFWLLCVEGNFSTGPVYLVFCMLLIL